MLEAGILPQEGRFQALAKTADLLPQEQYHRWADVPAGEPQAHTPSSEQAKAFLLHLCHYTYPFPATEE